MLSSSKDEEFNGTPALVGKELITVFIFGIEMDRVSLKSKFIFPGMKIKALEMLRRMKLITSNPLRACASQQEKLSNTDRDIYT